MSGRDYARHVGVAREECEPFSRVLPLALVNLDLHRLISVRVRDRISVMFQIIPEAVHEILSE